MVKREQPKKSKMEDLRPIRRRCRFSVFGFINIKVIRYKRSKKFDISHTYINVSFGNRKVPFLVSIYFYFWFYKILQTEQKNDNEPALKDWMR